MCVSPSAHLKTSAKAFDKDFCHLFSKQVKTAREGDSEKKGDKMIESEKEIGKRSIFS